MLLYFINIINILFCLPLIIAALAVCLWILWLVPPIIKFSLWALVMLIVVVPFLALWHLGLAFVAVLSIFFPIRAVFYGLLTAISFTIRLLSLWWSKVYRYTMRYFVFSSSINIMFDDLDLYWVEVLRDWLYPNDDRYYQIYRRWVFWTNNDKYQERYDYFVTFFWGYLARNFVIATYLAWFYSLRFINKMIMKYCGTAVGSTVVFSIMSLLALLFKSLPWKIAEFGWFSYRFIYRQMYYLTGNFITFEMLKTLNWNWMDWDISSNVDEFEEPDYTLARHPSSRAINFFYFINHEAALFRRAGLYTLNLLAKKQRLGWQLLLHILVILLLCFNNLILFILSFLTHSISWLFHIQCYLLRKFNLKLIKISSLKQFANLILTVITSYCYNIILAFSGWLKPAFAKERGLNHLILFAPAMMFYIFVQFWRIFFSFTTRFFICC